MLPEANLCLQQNEKLRRRIEPRNILVEDPR